MIFAFANGVTVRAQPYAVEPGHALYPAGLTRAEIEAYVQKNPARKPAIWCM